MVTKVYAEMLLSEKDEVPFSKIRDKILKSKEFIKALNKNVEDTKKTGVEHGFVICSNEKYTPSSYCKGSKCKLEIPSFKTEKECMKGGTQMVGTHHTHPSKNRAYFSNSDIAEFMRDVLTDKRDIDHDKYIECVSSLHEDEDTKCYVPSRKITLDDYHKIEKRELINPNEIVIAPPGFYRLSIRRKEKE